MLAALLLILLMFLAVPGQAFMPEIQMLNNAAVPLVPLLVFYTAVRYTLPWALLAAGGAGVFWDATWGRLMENGLSTPLGWTMLLLGVPCVVYHLIAFERRHHRLLSYALLAGFGVLAMQLADFIFISLGSESFVFPGSLLFPDPYQRMLWTSLLAMLAAPFIYLLFTLLGAPPTAEEERAAATPEDIPGSALYH